MADSVIFNSPLILGGFALALILFVFELRTNSTGYVLPMLSVLLFIGVTIYSLLSGAILQEIVIVIMIFLIINISAFKKHGDKK